MRRNHWILLGLLVVQVALAAWFFWPKSAETAQGHPLFPGLNIDEVVAVTIADDSGKELELRKVAGEWVLPKADDFPAKKEKVMPLLEKVAALNTGRLVARTTASHRQLQVAEDAFVRRVDLETADGNVYTLYIGSSPRYGVVHVRVGGQNEVYLARELNVWDIAPNANLWIDPLYLSVPQDTLSRVTLHNANGTFVFEKGETTEDGTIKWMLTDLAPGETQSEGEVRLLINQATNLNMIEPLGKEPQASYGLDQPSAIVTLTTATDVITLTLGAEDAETRNVVAKASTSPYYVYVAKNSVMRLLEATREKLVPPPTPTPTSVPVTPSPPSMESTPTPTLSAQ